MFQVFASLLYSAPVPFLSFPLFTPRSHRIQAPPGSLSAFRGYLPHTDVAMVAGLPAGGSWHFLKKGVEETVLGLELLVKCVGSGLILWVLQIARWQRRVVMQDRPSHCHESLSLDSDPAGTNTIRLDLVKYHTAIIGALDLLVHQYFQIYPRSHSPLLAVLQQAFFRRQYYIPLRSCWSCSSFTMCPNFIAFYLQNHYTTQYIYLLAIKARRKIGNTICTQITS